MFDSQEATVLHLAEGIVEQGIGLMEDRSGFTHLPMKATQHSTYCQIYYQIYSKYIPSIFQIYSKYISNIFQIYSKYIPNIFPNIFQIYSKYIPNIFQIYSKYIPNILPNIFQVYSKYITKYIPHIFQIVQDHRFFTPIFHKSRPPLALGIPRPPGPG